MVYNIGVPPAGAGSPAVPLFFDVSRIPAANVSAIPQRSPLRYPGGKTWLVPHIREWLGGSGRRVLVEPFAGGAVVSLTAVMEGLADRCVLMERDREVAAFWKAVLADPAAMAEKVLRCEPSLEMVKRIEREHAEGCVADVMEHGFGTLVLNRTRVSGVLAPGASYIKSGDGKGIRSRWYPETLASRIGAIGRAADRIEFREGDAMELLGPLLDERGGEAAVFVDPPYTASGGKRAGRRLYAHNDIDHARLFEVLAGRDTDFLMTYDCSDEIIDLIRFHGFCAVSVRMQTAHHRFLPELVITREPIFGP